MRRAGPIPANTECRTPKRVIALHCETIKTKRGTGYVQTFRSATVIESYRLASGEWSEPVELTFDDPEALWEEITDYTRVRARTWLVSYLAGNQLRIAQAFKYLPRLGWITNPDPIVGDNMLSIGWHNDKRSLLSVDLFSYLPHSLESIEKWTISTDHRIRAIYQGFLELIELQHDYDLGNFSRTGASNSSNHFRHRHMTTRIWVHDNDDALTAERASIFTGRTEAWHIGAFRHLDEWDLPLAYARVGLDTALPVRLLGLRTGRLPRRGPTSFLGFAHVRCTVPVLPCRSGGPGDARGGQVSWPVGEFSGWYWQDELALAEAYGAEVEVTEAYEYATAPVLSDWALWIMQSQSPHVQLSPVQQSAAKHWGRALIGKFGAMIPDWRDGGSLDDCDLELCTEIDDRYGRGERLTIGGRSLVSFEKRYTDNAFPALMSRVVSECRMRLWKLMCVAGLDHVFYVDTDSLFVDRIGSQNLKTFTTTGGGWGVRIKAHHDAGTILGPRQLILAGGPRVSGLPKDARELGNQMFGAQATESFRAGAGTGRSAEIMTSARTFTIRGSDSRRRHLTDGSTEAIAI